MHLQLKVLPLASLVQIRFVAIKVLKVCSAASVTTYPVISPIAAASVTLVLGALMIATMAIL